VCLVPNREVGTGKKGETAEGRSDRGARLTVGDVRK